MAAFPFTPFRKLIRINGGLIPWVCGNNHGYQLGLGDTTNRTAFEEHPFIFSNVSNGGYMSGSIVNEKLYIWGSDLYSGGFGVGDYGVTNIQYTTPTLVDDGDYKAVSFGRYHGLFLRTNGDLYAAGTNTHAQIGAGGAIDEQYPSKVLIGSGYALIFAGYHNSFAIKSNGDLYAWGSNSFGCLGGGFSSNQFTPQFIGSGYRQVSGALLHTLALKTNDDLMVTGDNLYGQLGIGALPTSINTMTLLGSDYKDASASFLNSLAIKNNGNLYAFGSNSWGEITYGSNVPYLIGTEFKEVCCIQQNSFVLARNGDLYGTGYNARGELGLGDSTPRNALTLIGTGYSSLPESMQESSSIFAFK